MRKIFGGAMLFSVIGAVVLGGSLAWSATKNTGENQITVGTIDFSISYFQLASLLGPNGTSTQVGGGQINNTGTFNLVWDSGAVFIINVTPGNGNSCGVQNFSGTVNPVLALAQSPIGQPIPPGANNVDGYVVNIATALNAQVACQGAAVSYVVAITMKTDGN